MGCFIFVLENRGGGGGVHSTVSECRTWSNFAYNLGNSANICMHGTVSNARCMKNYIP